ncbi:hypothetical protein D3C87_1229330 [compost metagenome]
MIPLDLLDNRTDRRIHNVKLAVAPATNILDGNGLFPDCTGGVDNQHLTRHQPRWWRVAEGSFHGTMRKRDLRYAIRHVDIESRAEHLDGQVFRLHDKGTVAIRHDIKKSFALQHLHITAAIGKISGKRTCRGKLHPAAVFKGYGAALCGTGLIFGLDMDEKRGNEQHRKTERHCCHRHAGIMPQGPAPSRCLFSGNARQVLRVFPEAL